MAAAFEMHRFALPLGVSFEMETQSDPQVGGIRQLHGKLTGVSR
jgi:hypothetical protein